MAYFKRAEFWHRTGAQVGEIPTDLHHEPAVWPASDSSNVHFSRRQLDDDDHIIGDEPADRGDLDGEKVSTASELPLLTDDVGDPGFLVAATFDSPEYTVAFPGIAVGAFPEHVDVRKPRLVHEPTELWKSPQPQIVDEGVLHAGPVPKLEVNLAEDMVCHGIEVGLIPDVGEPLESFPLLHQELSLTAAPRVEYEEAAGQERAMSVVDVGTHILPGLEDGIAEVESRDQLRLGVSDLTHVFPNELHPISLMRSESAHVVVARPLQGRLVEIHAQSEVVATLLHELARENRSPAEILAKYPEARAGVLLEVSGEELRVLLWSLDALLIENVFVGLLGGQLGFLRLGHGRSSGISLGVALVHGREEHSVSA